MMRVALVGYGKMGREIEKVLHTRGHGISWKITEANAADLLQINPENTDVCIEFTSPQSAQNNLLTLFSQGMSVVCGTTGWYGNMGHIIQKVDQAGVSFIAASNFSVGVNIFFEAASKLAELMKPFPGYGVEIHETHHTEKKDAPSGTAITLSEMICAVDPAWTGYHTAHEHVPGIIPIHSHRISGVPGIHELFYRNEIDEISLRHTAFSRAGFALGAVMAAEFIQGKTGVFSFRDVMDIK